MEFKSQKNISSKQLNGALNRTRAGHFGESQGKSLPERGSTR